MIRFDLDEIVTNPVPADLVALRSHSCRCTRTRSEKRPRWSGDLEKASSPVAIGPDGKKSSWRCRASLAAATDCVLEGIAPSVSPVTRETACECGAPSECLHVWHEALAAEQHDQAMYAWHAPLVCAFYLQHRSMHQPRFADGQYRLLQLFVDRGIEAVHAVAREHVARNRGSTPAFPAPELARYRGLPARSFPDAFGVSVHVLREKGGDFISQGYTAYGDRMRYWAQATIDGWRVAPGVC